MRHNVSVPLVDLTIDQLHDVILELGPAYREVAAQVKLGAFDGSFINTLEKEDKDELLKELDGNLKTLFRKNLVHKLTILKQAQKAGSRRNDTSDGRS